MGKRQETKKVPKASRGGEGVWGRGQAGVRRGDFGWRRGPLSQFPEKACAEGPQRPDGREAGWGKGWKASWLAPGGREARKEMSLSALGMGLDDRGACELLRA